MDRYTIYCTEEQCEKAVKLGAEIPRISHSLGEPFKYECTAEQMVGWLETKIIEIVVQLNYEHDCYSYYICYDIKTNAYNYGYANRPEATLAAIDAALNYLIEDKQ